jgi:hypothetical protein
MSGISKIFFTEQAKLSQLTYGQLESILADNESTIYIDTNGVLKIAEKQGGVVTEKNATGDEVKSLAVNDVPTSFPFTDEGYALMAVQDGDNFKLIWGRVNTIGNYNVISGSTTYTVLTGAIQYQNYDASKPGTLPFNGAIFIGVSGDGAYAAKRYSLDGGLTFTGYDNNDVAAFYELGSLTGATYNLVIQDSAEAVIYSDTIELDPPDYSWDFIEADLYSPVFMEHTIFKTDDPNPTNPQTFITVVVQDDDTFLPGLYLYQIFLNGMQVILTDVLPDKIFSFPIDFSSVGEFTAIVKRVNAGYIEVDDLTAQGLTYAPTDFLWSKDGGYTFLTPSYSTEPIRITAGDTVRVNYTADEAIGDKLIYMRRNSTNEVYQTTQTINQVETTSVPVNLSVTTTLVNGTYDDSLFASIFVSNNYFVPTTIARTNPGWVPNASPPNDPIDFTFIINFLSTSFIGNPNTEMRMLIEDLDGNTITTAVGTFISADPVKGMFYEFYFIDFDNTITPYLAQTIRIRFTFDPDSVDPDPNQNFVSALKYVRYV